MPLNKSTTVWCSLVKMGSGMAKNGKKFYLVKRFFLNFFQKKFLTKFYLGGY